jgi:UDP-GlcNAc:undecaprenyl-phosphate GlcNAc-1-phosphate transferase
MAGIVVALGPAAGLLAPHRLVISTWEVIGFCLAAFMVFALGVADDIVGLRVSVKFLVQIAAATIMVAMGWQFTAIRIPLEGYQQLGALGPLLSVVWIVGVTNAVNLIDGLDGLAVGIVAIIGCNLLILAALQGSFWTILVTSSIVGSCLGFLRYNWGPARIYLGDSGSLILGFLLAVVSMRSTPSVKATTALAVIVPVLALGLPVIDTLLVMWSRFLRGHDTMNRFAGMFQADRVHVHHLLVDGRTSGPRVMLILYGLATVFCAMALLVAASGNWRLGLAFLLVQILAVILVRSLGWRAQARCVVAHEIERLGGGLGAERNGALRREPASSMPAQMGAGDAAPGTAAVRRSARLVPP